MLSIQMPYFMYIICTAQNIKHLLYSVQYTFNVDKCKYITAQQDEIYKNNFVCSKNVRNWGMILEREYFLAVKYWKIEYIGLLHEYFSIFDYI